MGPDRLRSGPMPRRVLLVGSVVARLGRRHHLRRRPRCRSRGFAGALVGGGWWMGASCSRDSEARLNGPPAARQHWRTYPTLYAARRHGTPAHRPIGRAAARRRRPRRHPPPRGHHPRTSRSTHRRGPHRGGRTTPGAARGARRGAAGDGRSATVRQAPVPRPARQGPQHALGLHGLGPGPRQGRPGDLGRPRGGAHPGRCRRDGHHRHPRPAPGHRGRRGHHGAGDPPGGAEGPAQDRAGHGRPDPPIRAGGAQRVAVRGRERGGQDDHGGEGGQAPGGGGPPSRDGGGRHVPRRRRRAARDVGRAGGSRLRAGRRGRRPQLDHLRRRAARRGQGCRSRAGRHRRDASTRRST